MKSLSNTLLYIAVVLVWCGFGCSQAPVQEEGPRPLPAYDPSSCGAEYGVPGIRAQAWSTGPVNNIVRVDDDVAWVVQSGGNTVGRLTLETGQFDPDFIDVGNDRNPWDVASGDGRLFVTNFLTGSVSVVARDSGAVLGEVADAGLVSPSGLAFGGGRLFVASSGFVGPGYQEPAVVVFDVLEQAPWLTVLATLRPQGLNTLLVHWDAERDALYTVSSGETIIEDGGQTTVLSDAVIERFSGDTLERSGSLVLERTPDDTRSGAPGDFIVQGSFAYLPSRVTSHIYKIDLENWEVLRGPTDPIVSYLGDGNQLTGMAPGPGGTAYVTAFNQDALYIFDTSCDATVAGPYDVGRSDFLEGPVDVAYDPQTGKALVLLSISSALTEVIDP